MQTNMYDSDIQSDADAKKRADEIQTSVFSAPAELKIYFENNRTGDYFYTCSYPIEHKYVGIGDSITLFSYVSSDAASRTSSVKAVKATHQRSVADQVKRVTRVAR